MMQKVEITDPGQTTFLAGEQVSKKEFIEVNSKASAEGIKLEYVDPSDLVYSYTESPYFDDIYYVGEIRRVSIPELKKQFPYLTNEEVDKTCNIIMATV